MWLNMISAFSKTNRNTKDTLSRDVPKMESIADRLERIPKCKFERLIHL
jgi:hypothetical protein